MKQQYSPTRQLLTKIPQRVSTQQIKVGLQRIKKAQQQVLEQLKKNHHNSYVQQQIQQSSYGLQRNLYQNLNLKRQINLQRQKSLQKSTLYRRRVVDLQSSLNLHLQNQQRLRLDMKILEQQAYAYRKKYQDLQPIYKRLIQQSQISATNLRMLQKQLLELKDNKDNKNNKTKIKQQQITKLHTQFQILTNQRNTIMSQKVNLLKKNSKLQSQNIQLKQKITNSQLKLSTSSSPIYKTQQLTILLNQINKMNSSHQTIYSILKSNTKLSRNIIDKQNIYQNSLNKILEKLMQMQKIQGNNSNNVIIQQNYQFDQEISMRQQIKKMQLDINRKYKKQIMKLQAQKQQLIYKYKIKDRELQQKLEENKLYEVKINQLHKQKTQLLSEISEITAQKQNLKKVMESQSTKKLQLQRKKQQNRDQQYRTIIGQLNEQMKTIQKQKKDLDGLIGKMGTVKTQEQQKSKKKLDEILAVNGTTREQNQKIKLKYQQILLQKQTIYLSLTQIQNKYKSLNKQIAKEVLLKQKYSTQLSTLRSQLQLLQTQSQTNKLVVQKTKLECQKINNSYLLQIQRLIQEGLMLRQQIQILNGDRRQLRDLKGKYGLLMKDNQLLGKKSKHMNGLVDHLWTIKQVQYENINKIMSQFKPL